MFETFNSVRNVFEYSKITLAAYVEQSEIDAFESELRDRTQNGKPIVMVYGVYNAGKSTLLNALLGQELAEVGDIPKTAEVSPYQIGDVEILDTPGIDAPIEHEEVTREQLAKSDAVIFVLSSDGVVDEQQTYNEIGKILNAGKPLIVVINNKSNHKESDESYLVLKDHFRNNLYQHFRDDEFILTKLDKTEEFLVNAKIALKGKLENKEKLVEFSHITQLESAVTRLFEQTNSAQIAHTLTFQLGELLSQGIQSAESNAGNIELKKLSDWIGKAYQAQAALENRIRSRSENLKPSLKTSLRAAVHTGHNDQIEECVAQWNTELVTYFQCQMERTIRHLDLEAEQLVSVLSQSPSYSQYFVQHTANKEEASGITSLLSGFAAQLSKTHVTDDAMKEGIVLALKKGKDFAPALFKGIGPKTMEKMASKFVPFIGPAIDVIMAAYSYYKARQQEQLEVAMERHRLESMNTQVDKFINELYDSFYEAITDTLEDTFKPIILPLETALEELSLQQGGVESDIRALRRYKENLV